MNHWRTAIRKYADFSGRASRAEYWVFILMNIVIAFVLGFIDGLLGISGDADTSYLVNLYQLFVLIPTLAAVIRRMHDVNKSGWFMLIPIYGLILALTPGTNGDNRYGANPTVSSNTLTGEV